MGSLINPEMGVEKGSLFGHKWEKVEPLLTRLLSGEKNDEKTEMSVIAQGMAKSAQILTGKYFWIITNVPYLARSKQNNTLRKHLENFYSIARMDLATSFLYQCYELSEKGGTVSMVLPQNWLYQSSYKILRKRILKKRHLNIIVRLGEGGFESSAAAGAFVALFTSTNNIAPLNSTFSGINVADINGARSKAESLRESSHIFNLFQHKQLENPDSIISLTEIDTDQKTLGDYFNCYQGLRTGDSIRFIRNFW